MSVLSDFFVASADELLAAFPTWFPVAPSPVKEKKVPNPFKPGEYMVIRGSQWKRIDRPTDISGNEGYDHLPHVMFKHVLQIQLSVLADQLGVISYDDCMSQLQAPALLPAEDEAECECGLHAIPDNLTNALADLGENSPAIASAWGESEEVRMSASDALEVLQGIATLAKTAVDSNKRLYLFWSL